MLLTTRKNFKYQQVLILNYNKTRKLILSKTSFAEKFILDFSIIKKSTEYFLL